MQNPEPQYDPGLLKAALAQLNPNCPPNKLAADARASAVKLRAIAVAVRTAAAAAETTAQEAEAKLPPMAPDSSDNRILLAFAQGACAAAASVIHAAEEAERKASEMERVALGFEQNRDKLAVGLYSLVQSLPGAGNSETPSSQNG